MTADKKEIWSDVATRC